MEHFVTNLVGYWLLFMRKFFNQTSPVRPWNHIFVKGNLESFQSAKLSQVFRNPLTSSWKYANNNNTGSQFAYNYLTVLHINRRSHNSITKVRKLIFLADNRDLPYRIQLKLSSCSVWSHASPCSRGVIKLRDVSIHELPILTSIALLSRDVTGNLFYFIQRLFRDWCANYFSIIVLKVDCRVDIVPTNWGGGGDLLNIPIC